MIHHALKNLLRESIREQMRLLLLMKGVYIYMNLSFADKKKIEIQ